MPLETLYRLALEAGQIGVWTWDPASDRLSLDERACSILGLASDEGLTMARCDGLIDPAHRDERRRAWQAALDPDGGGDFSAEYRLVSEPGQQPRWISTRGKVVFSDGRPQRVAGVLRDVTDRRRSEEALRHSEARFAGIVSLAADAIISINGTQRITLFNHGAEQIFGYQAAEVLGQPIDVLLPERTRQTHAEHVRRFAASQTAARRMAERAEIFGRRKSGDEFAAEASISRIEVDDELLFSVVLRDVSERKRAQELLARSHSELEKRVAERTSELEAEMRRREQTQAQLVRTQRMEAFGQLTGGVAHDFNNLLTVITGNLELLEMRLRDEKNRTLLKRAYDAAEMGARLTSRLLTFARRRQFTTTPLNLNDQVMSMADLLQRTLGENIDLTTRLEPRLWQVRANASEIENAVLNLAINARDAMPRGGRLIIETTNVTLDEGQVGTVNRLPAGEYVRLSVSDTGMGMPPAVLQKAFEPFFTTKQPGKGTGLGLSTIYGFVQELGGTVTIYSEVGRGTTVSVYLPRRDGEIVAETATGGTSSECELEGRAILLVEDNTEVRVVTRQRLERLGCTVYEAENGPEAVRLLQSGVTVDLVFSDVIMTGGMSGFDLARWVRAEHPGIKLLLTSGFAEDLLATQDVQHEEFLMLRKPYGHSELAAALRRAIGS